MQREGEGWKWGVEISISKLLYEDFPGGSDGQVSFYNAGDLGSIPGSVRSPGEGNGNPLQYSCLENPMDGGAMGYSPRGRKESDMTKRLSQVYFHFQSLK